MFKEISNTIMMPEYINIYFVIFNNKFITSYYSIIIINYSI
jgi:hypothetical protein